MKQLRWKLALVLAFVMIFSAGFAWADAYSDVKKAGKLLVKGKLDEAKSILSPIIECRNIPDQGLAIAYNYRGLVWFKKGCYECAAKDFTCAITLVPEYGVAYYNRALAYTKLGCKEKAAKDMAMFKKLKEKFGVAPGAPAKVKPNPPCSKVTKSCAPKSGKPDCKLPDPKTYEPQL